MIKSDHMGVFSSSSLSVLHLNVGRTESLCHISPPSPSFPPPVSRSSPPLAEYWRCAAQRARQAAWTWRCLGRVTHDDIIKPPSEARDTVKLSWIDFQLFWFFGGKTVLSLLKTFVCFPVLGWDSFSSPPPPSQKQQQQRVWMTFPLLIPGSRRL